MTGVTVEPASVISEFAGIADDFAARAQIQHKLPTIKVWLEQSSGSTCTSPRPTPAG